MALFALIAALAVLVSLWNPFPKPSRTNVYKIKLGMTKDDVAELVGQPGRVVDKANGVLAHAYDLGNGEAFGIFYKDGRVTGGGRPFFHDAAPKDQ